MPVRSTPGRTPTAARRRARGRCSGRPASPTSTSPTATTGASTSSSARRGGLGRARARRGGAWPAHDLVRAPARAGARAGLGPRPGPARAGARHDQGAHRARLLPPARSASPSTSSCPRASPATPDRVRVGPRVGVSGPGGDGDGIPVALLGRRRAERVGLPSGGRAPPQVMPAMRDRAVLVGPRATAYGRLCPGGQGARWTERTPIPVTDIFDELQWRGLVAQTTDEAALREALAEGPITLYCGFDPSAPSLHFGNFVQLSVMRRMQARRAPGHLSRRRVDRAHRRPEARRRARAAGQGHHRRGGEPHPAAGRAAARLRGRQRGRARQQPGLDGADERARLPARRRPALPRQPDDPEGGRRASARERPGDLLHRVQLPDAPGARLPRALPEPWLHAADRGQRPVGQHHRRRRPRAPGRGHGRCTRSRRRCSSTRRDASSASRRATPSG